MAGPETDAQTVAAVPAGALDAPRFTLGKLLPWITTPLLLCLMFGIWHVYVEKTGISAFILPPPAAVWEAWKEMIVAPATWDHTWTTIYETLAGFFWALVIGVSLGVALGRMRWLELTLTPFIVASQVVPKVALVPLMIVWFGFGVTPKILIAAVLAFFQF